MGALKVKRKYRVRSLIGNNEKLNINEIRLIAEKSTTQLVEEAKNKNTNSPAEEEMVITKWL